MSRALVAIGCDSYDHISGLSSAESDAARLSELLLGTNRYQYRADISSVLQSPTMAEVRQAILALYVSNPAEVCFYFAGHAESRDGRLFLKFRDARDGVLLPPTSMPLSEVLDLLSQSPGIKQVNVIIDACNAGGLRADLARVLGERAQASVGVLSLSILAGAGPTHGARENASGGHLTTSICNILDGTTTVQRWRPFLDLAQVFEGVMRNAAVAAQNPSYWGMNLSGANALGPNPKFDPATAANANPESFVSGAVSLKEPHHEAIRRFVETIRTEGWSVECLRPLQATLASVPENEQVSIYLALGDIRPFRRHLRISVEDQDGTLTVLFDAAGDVPRER